MLNPYYPQMQQNPYMTSRQPYMDMLPQQTSNQYPIKGRPVASLEEARASMIDFDGSIFYFPDAGNQKIYTKQINLDGTSSLKVYSLVQDPSMNIQTQNLQQLPQQEELPTSVSKEEFDKKIGELMEEINNLKGAMNKNDEQSTATSNDVAAIKF